MSDAKILMEVRGVSKSFGPTVALKNVDITVRAGEIRGLIGENGSGKSTVTSIYAGMQPADSGEMYFLGERWEPTSMVDAMRHGVGMIVQETGTIADIPVAENIFLGEEDAFRPWKTKKGGTWGPVNRRALLRAAQAALDDSICRTGNSSRSPRFGCATRRFSSSMRRRRRSPSRGATSSMT